MNICCLRDADCLPVSNQWIREMAGNYMTGDYDFVLGVSQYEKMKGFLNKFIRFETFLVCCAVLVICHMETSIHGIGKEYFLQKRCFLEK